MIAPGAIVILLACVLHAVWAVLLIIDPIAASGATPLAGPALVFGRGLLIALILSTVFSLLGLLRGIRGLKFIGCTAPQLFLVLLSASAPVRCIFLSMYADLEPRPRAFIAADQAGIVLFAAFYATSFCLLAARRNGAY